MSAGRPRPCSALRTRPSRCCGLSPDPGSDRHMTAAATALTATAHSTTAISRLATVWRRRRLLTKMRGVLRGAGAEAGRRRSREPRTTMLDGLRWVAIRADRRGGTRHGGAVLH
jgi:hypothetical protein